MLLVTTGTSPPTVSSALPPLRADRRGEARVSAEPFFSSRLIREVSSLATPQ